MATNKNALMRYKVLDKCFRNPGKRYFIDDLIQECSKTLSDMSLTSAGISRRQIFEDITFMESEAGWAIDLTRPRDGKRVYYRYADMSFSINNMPLNELEITQLKTAVDILSQFKGMPQFEWVHELLPKLQQGTFTENNQSVIEFDGNQYLRGIEKIGPLHAAIIYKKVLKIKYQPYEHDAADDVILHPYYLKQYNNRWFLFGYNPAKKRYDWNMAVDRIIDFSETRSKYQKNTEVDWSEYFEDMIGVTKKEGTQAEKVVVQFHGKTAKYIETKPLHGSQKSKWVNKATLEVSLSVLINYELERLILSYCDVVTVLRPTKLRNTISTRLAAAKANFGAVQNDLIGDQ